MVGVEQMMRFLSEGLAEIVAIERLHVGIFVREAQRFALVEPPEHAAACLRQLLPVMNGLTAAARAAAGTGHDLDKVIADLATLDGVEQLPRVAESAHHRDLHPPWEC